MDAKRWLEVDAERLMSIAIVRITPEQYQAVVDGDVSADNLLPDGNQLRSYVASR